MRIHERWPMGLLSLVLLIGCASNPAPHGYLVGAGEEISDTRGAWIELDLLGSPGGRSWLEGELLACDADSVHVLVARKGLQGPADVFSCPWRQVGECRARAYDPGTGTYAAWTAAGTLSTISHGYFLALTAPIWILAGTLMTAQQSGTADFHRGDDVEWLRPWARFPQGLPPGLDRHGLTLRSAIDPDTRPLRFQREPESSPGP